MRSWFRSISEEDRAAFAASVFGVHRGFGHRPAILVIDATYDFVGMPDASLEESRESYPYSCGPSGWRAVAAIRALLDAARAARVPVFFTRARQEDQAADADPALWRIAPVDRRPRPELPDGNAIVPQLAPMPGEVVLDKGRPSGFFGTDLASRLTRLQVDSVFVCGMTTSGCVRATVVDAFSYRLNVTVVEECVADRFQTSHDVALFDMDSKYADVVSLSEALAHLESLRRPAGVEHRPSLVPPAASADR